MKRIQNLVSSLVVCGVAFSLVSSLVAQTPEMVTAKVIRIKGSARFTSGNNVWQPLKVGAILKPGTVVQTGIDQGTYVDLVLGEGSDGSVTPVVYNPSAATSASPSSGSSYAPKAEQNVVRITENSMMGIDKLTSMNTGADVVTETQLDLKAGRILGTVKKMSATSRYEIKLPNGVAGIRGSTYDVDIRKKAKIKMFSGSCVYAYVGDGGAVITPLIDAGFYFDGETGKVSPIPLDEFAPANADFQGMTYRGHPLTAPPPWVAAPALEHVSPFIPPGHQ
jgi:hypothetical protein